MDQQVHVNESPASPNDSKMNRVLSRFPWKIFSIAFAAGYLAIVCYFGDVSPAAMLGYFLGQIAFTLIPGMALGAIVSVSGEKIKFLCLSYFLGVFINIVFYVVFYLAHMQDYLLYGMIAASALSVFCLYKKRSYYKSLKTNRAGAAVLSVSTAILLVMVLYYTICNNFTPDFTANTHYYQDMLFNTGNISALYLQFPPQDIRDLGFSFNYNYLYTLFLAIYKNLFGISSFDLNFKLFAVTQAVLFSASLYLLFQKVMRNMLWVAVAIFLSLFVDDALFAHVMWAAFSTTFGLVMCAVTCYFFFKYIENPEPKPGDKNFWLAILFFGMTAFAKSPFSLILLAGIAVILLYRLLGKKSPKTVLLHGIVTIAVMGLSYIMVYWNVVGFNGLTRGLATIMTSSAPSYYVSAMQSLAATISPTLIKIMVYPVFLALNYTYAVIAFFLMLGAAIRWRREGAQKEMFMLAAIAIGIILASVTTQPGLSNMLFLMILAPLSIFAIALFFKRYFSMQNAKPVFRRVFLIVVCALLGLHFILSIGSILKNADVIKSYPIGGLSAQPEVNRTPDPSRMSYDEYQGMLWLRNNTPRNAVIAGDRYYYTPSAVLDDARYFYYTAFSERQFYIEGYEYTNTTEKNFAAIIQDKLDTMQRVYQNDPAAIAKLKAAGVTYLVRSEYTNASFQLSREFGDIVFGNKDIIIYKLK